MMSRISFLFSIFLLCVSCATSYQKSGFTGGYFEKKVSDQVYRVTFGGNGFTSRETVQTYWLYRASELTLERGYEYFEIMHSLFSGIDYWADGLEPRFLASVVMIPMSVQKPVIELDIRMHKSPFRPKPPKSFNAKKLKKALEPHVKGKLCDKQVCPHEKMYLEK